MAIKNNGLGGEDWVIGDFVNSDDLNDTFDAFYEVCTQYTGG